jgi:hypothetical protein
MTVALLLAAGLLWLPWLLTLPGTMGSGSLMSSLTGRNHSLGCGGVEYAIPMGLGFTARLILDSFVDGEAGVSRLQPNGPRNDIRGVVLGPFTVERFGFGLLEYTELDLVKGARKGCRSG